MASCCHTDYRKVFRTSEGYRDVKAYRRAGLRGTELISAELSLDLALESPSLLEVGAGVGALHVDLLRSGASTATAVDISAGWDAAAATLLAEHQLTDRVRRVVGDFVAESAAVPGADVVLLHRVICCYEDWEALVDAAIDHARRAIVFTIPAEKILAHLALWGFNSWLRLQRCGFRAFVHPIGAILDRFAAAGFAATGHQPTWAWETFRLERQ